MGKHVIFHMEERPRVKIVDYTGSTKVERTKIDEKMKELGIALRLDSFLDQAVVKRVEGIVKSFMAEKGYEFAEVKSRVEALPGGPKLVKVVFDVKEGPKVKVRDIELHRQRRGQRRHAGEADEGHQGALLAVVDHRQGHLSGERSSRRTPKRSIEFYREQGLHRRRASAQPEIKTLEDSERQGNALGRSCASRSTRARATASARSSSTATRSSRPSSSQPLFKLKTGRVVLGEARSARASRRRARCTAAAATSSSPGFPDIESARPRPRGRSPGPAQPTVNVTMRMTEGEQYFVNRITFTGNTTTRDNVIRREMRLRRRRRRSTPRR